MNLSQEICFKAIDIMKIRNAQNCSEHCIPFTMSSFFNVTEINVCKSFADHFCAFGKIVWFLYEKTKTCLKLAVEKNFKGSLEYKEDYDIIYPETINEDKKKKTLLLIQWKYLNQLTTIIEEKLVYDSKDLLAWLGGALGIFIGYSFFDFAKHIIDVVFYCVYRKMNSN